ncbi:hypothetical protein TIFTF001_028897 [Ficus carica]|uniref:Uncharacterized protein n=1 Tax=Ficus carica TaxID=3494 RepID=A0AA88DQV5_FICCA|nr:hypothetical protein TIFTF001_028897 [Ficus carica]
MAASPHHATSGFFNHMTEPTSRISTLNTRSSSQVSGIRRLLPTTEVKVGFRDEDRSWISRYGSESRFRMGVKFGIGF